MKNLLAITAVMATFAISGCSDSDGIPEGDPSAEIDVEMRGHEVGPGVMVAQGDAVHWVQSAVAGYRTTGEEDLPSRVTLEPVMGGCQFRAPAAGEMVANIHIGRSTMKSPVFTFSRKDLAERTERWLAAYKRDGENAGSPSDGSGDQLKAVDVVVTEVAKPLYLVLQNEWSNVVWNIHAAPGARIAHVAVLGTGALGVANLDASVPVEFMNEARLERCKVTPVRQPADHWLFVQRAKAGTSGDLSDKLAENQQNHRAYSRWFRNNFGFDSERDVIGFDVTSHVLVGAVPATLEQRVPFKPLEGAEVRVAKEDYVLASSRADYRTRHDGIIRALAEKMVGGDLASLRPGS